MRIRRSNLIVIVACLFLAISSDCKGQDSPKPRLTIFPQEYLHRGYVPIVEFLPDDRHLLMAHMPYTGESNVRIELLDCETGQWETLVTESNLDLVSFSSHTERNEVLIAEKSLDAIFVSRVDLNGNQHKLGSVEAVAGNPKIQLFSQPGDQPPILIVDDQVFLVEGKTSEPLIELDSVPRRFAAKLIDGVFFVGLEDGVKAFSVDSGTLLASYRTSAPVTAIGGEDHNRILIVLDAEDGTIDLFLLELLDVELRAMTNAIHPSLSAKRYSISFIEFINDIQVICSGYASSQLVNLEDGDVEIWRPGFQFHGTLSGDKEKLAVVEGCRIAIRDPITGDRLNSVHGHDQFFTMKFDSRKQLLKTKQADGLICTWSLSNGKLLETTTNNWSITDFDANTEFDLAASRVDGSFNRFEITQFGEAEEATRVEDFVTDHEFPVQKIYPVSGNRLATLSIKQRVIGIYQPNSRIPIFELNAMRDFEDSGPQSHFDQFEITKNGYAIVSFSQDREGLSSEVRVIRLDDQEHIYSINSFLSAFGSWNEEKDQIAFAEGDQLVLRRLSTGEIIKETDLSDLENPFGITPFHKTCISPDGDWIAVSVSTMEREDPTDPFSDVTGGENGFFLIDANSGEIVERFFGHSDNNISFLFSDDSKFLFSADRHGQIHQWDISELGK